MSHLIEMFLKRFGESVTLQTRSLDKESRDAETGWPPVTYTDSTIKIYVEPTSSRLINVNGEQVEAVRLQAYTTATVYQLDRIVRNGVTYMVEFTSDIHKKGSDVVYRRINLLRMS